MTEKNYTEINWLKISKKFLEWWCWTYIEKVNQRFYTTDQYIEECKKQWLTPLTVEHLKQIWFTEERTKENKELADKLWLKLTGYVDSGGKLWDKDEYGYLSSAFPVNENDPQAFIFNKNKGGLNVYHDYYDRRYYARPCLFLVENSNPTIWQFDYLNERAEENNITMKALNSLKKILPH